MINTNTIVELTGQRIELNSWLGVASWWEAGLDPGTGISTIYIQPVKLISRDRPPERGPIFRLSIPSIIDTGENSLARIANVRAAPKNRPASALHVGEFVIRTMNSKDEHLVGPLAELEGEHPTDRKGNPSRYWGEHILAIARALLAAIIPDTKAEIRLNLCMPFSLYTQENKEKAIQNLEGIHPYYFNEIYKEFEIKIGAVFPEGYAAITKYGSPNGNNVGIDIGDRTTEIIFAKGFKLVSRDSEGYIYGVRQVIEAIQEELLSIYGKSLDIEDIRIILKAYTSRTHLPSLKVPRGTRDGFLDSEAQYEIIARKTLPLARAIATCIKSLLNKEGAEIGSDLDTSTCYGGGAYLIHGPLCYGIPNDSELENGVLHDLYLPSDAEYINAAYLQEAVAAQTLSAQQRGIDIWERKRG